MMSSLIIIFFLSLIIILIRRRNKSHRTDRTRLPPGPKGLPLIGNLHRLAGKAAPHRALHRLSVEFGPIMFLQLGFVPTLVVSSADSAEEIFKTHDQVFSSRPLLFAPNKMSYNCSDLTFAPYGEYWREMRKLLVLELLSTKRVQSFDVIREQEVKSMVDFISVGSHEPINLSQLTLGLSNRVVCRVAFGWTSEECEGELRKHKFDEILRESQYLLGAVNVVDYLPWMGWMNRVNGFKSRLDKNFKQLDDFYNMIIHEHLESKKLRKEYDDDQEDLVDVLLQLQNDRTASQTSPFHNNQIKGILTDIFIAGTDTSAATLVWTMTELIKNPSVMRKAQEEVRGVVKGKTKVDENDIPKLKYLTSVIKESLRIHPPAPLLVPRETTENCTIQGYEIPAKTRVLVNATSIGMDNKYWDNPTEFNPERFLNSSVDFKGQHFEFIPFGIGRRSCPGINFASSLIELALANILCWFDWSLPHGVRAQDIDMEEALGITMTKKMPLCLGASKR